MKILVGSSAPPDRGAGISTYCREITHGLIAEGHRIVYASPAPVDFGWLEQNCSGFIETPFGGSMERLCKDVLEQIRGRGVEAVINNDNAVLQNLAPAFNCPMISVGHLDSTTIGALLLHNKEWVDYTVAISSDMHLNLMRRLSISPHRVPMIHNGIRHLAIDYSDLNLSDNVELRVVFGGGLIARKGGDRIKSLLELCSATDTIRFDIFGPLPKGIPKSLKNVKRVHFHDKVPREEFLRAMAEADVFLLPSRAEGCPMALLEAMSLSCIPVVSDGIGAMRWIVTNAEDGYVCRLVDWAREAALVLQFLQRNPEERSRLKRNARSRFENGFQVSVTVQKLLRLLETPTVNRDQLPSSFPIVKWHRQPNPNLMQRVYYRFGVLQNAGLFEN